MNFGFFPRAFFAAAGAVLIFSSTGDISAQSKGASSWENETSFAALTLRSIGFLKLGLGLGALAGTMVGTVSSEQVGKRLDELSKDEAHDKRDHT